MRLFGWRWLVVSSVVTAALAAGAETRPQYGGTLHVAMRSAPTSLDPADNTQPESFARRSLTWLMFDTLVSMDENARLQPSLATSWQATSGSQRWQFRMRRGVNFHDGTPLSPEAAAASLRAANPKWKVSADSESIVIETENADPDLLAELALARNAIAKRNPDGTSSGTGPFHVVDWQPGKKLELAAEENCWRGRPFLGAIEIEIGRSYRDELTALETGKEDLVEVAPEQTHVFNARVSPGRARLRNSAPMELLALEFTRDAASPEETLLRQALGWSIERGSIRSVLLQGAGEPAASLLPGWMSGYGFVFSNEADLARARHAREQVRTIPTWTLGYDGNDTLARFLAERIALNARDAGLSLQPTTAASADMRLVRIPLASPEPWVTLEKMPVASGVVARKEGLSIENLYQTEVRLRDTERVIPLFHMPASYAASTNLNNWSLRSDGSWALADAWLGLGKHE